MMENGLQIEMERFNDQASQRLFRRRGGSFSQRGSGGGDGRFDDSRPATRSFVSRQVDESFADTRRSGAPTKRYSEADFETRQRQPGRPFWEQKSSKQGEFARDFDDDDDEFSDDDDGAMKRNLNQRTRFQDGGGRPRRSFAGGQGEEENFAGDRRGGMAPTRRYGTEFAGRQSAMAQDRGERKKREFVNEFGDDDDELDDDGDFAPKKSFGRNQQRERFEDARPRRSFAGRQDFDDEEDFPDTRRSGAPSRRPEFESYQKQPSTMARSSPQQQKTRREMDDFEDDDDEADDDDAFIKRLSQNRTRQTSSGRGVPSRGRKNEDD